jgi:hypothetical protein
MYIEPFTKVKVVSSSVSKCAVDSIGYLGFCDIIRIGYNMWEANLVVVRSGKRGKPILKSIFVNIPIIDYKVFSEEDQALIQEVKYAECLESLDYPKIRKASVSKPEVELEMIPHDQKNLIDGPIHDYFAFVLVLASAIDRYSWGHRNSSTHFVTTGKARYTPGIQEFGKLPELMKVNKAIVGKMIAYAFRAGAGEVERLMEMFNTRVFRFQVLEALWKQAASSADWFNLYKEIKLMQTAAMLKHLGNIVVSWRHNPKSLELVKQNPTSLSAMCSMCKCPQDEWQLNDDREAGNTNANQRLGRFQYGGYVLHTTTPTRPHRNSNLVLERISEDQPVQQTWRSPNGKVYQVGTHRAENTGELHAPQRIYNDYSSSAAAHIEESDDD